MERGINILCQKDERCRRTDENRGNQTPDEIHQTRKDEREEKRERDQERDRN